MINGLTSIAFLVLVVISVFLLFQVNENSNNCKALKVRQQDQMQQAARHALESSTQQHPLFAFEGALRAKILLDNIIDSHGSTAMAENNLKLSPGKLDTLQKEIYAQYNNMQGFVMARIIEQDPKFDVDMNREAGIVVRKHHRRKKSKRRKHRSENYGA